MIINFLSKRFNSIKICAVFTAVSFIISTLGVNLYAIPMAENTDKKYEDIFNRTVCISNEYGKITSSKDGNSDITVINIQDLHCHPQTQRNISKIIGQIADKYNLKKVYVEGGYGNIDVSWLDSIKDENIRKQAIEKLLNEGMLTGSEYYKLINNNNKVELKGIDEEQVHKDNVRRLSWIIENQAKYENIIKKVENEVSMLENIYVNNRNKRFTRNIEDYSTNKIDSKTFYKQILKYVKDINANPGKYNNITAIRLEEYPNISKFVTLRKVSQDIDLKEVTQQLQIVVNELKNKLPYGVYTKFLSETENLSNSQKVLELITLLCDKEGINLEKYKSLNNFLKTNSITKNLNPIDLVQEERNLILEIRKALSYNNEEYEITFVSDFNKYFKDYLEYKLTDASWKYFEKNYDMFRQLYAKYATVDRIKEIEDDFAEINKYYDINDQRNNIFVKNLLRGEQINLISDNKIRQDEEILKASKEVIIAVTGGFHSTELEQMLAKNDVNTIVITPKIYEDIKQANDKYIELIGLQSRVKSQALSYTIFSSVTDADKQKILISIVKDICGGNVEKIKEVLGEDIDLSLLDETPIVDTKEKNEVRKIIETAINQVIAVIPQQGMKNIFTPNTDEIMLNMAEQLVRHGFYFSKGMVLGLEKLNGQDLEGIPAEIYARMLPSLQNALLKVSEKYEEVEQDIQDLYEDTATNKTAYIYLEDINNNYQNFISSLQDAITNKKLIVLHIFRNPIDIGSLDREEQQKLYHNIRDMFFKIYADKSLNKDNFVSLPENTDYLDYDIHFFLLEILENSFMHGNIGLDKPIYVYMDKDEQNEIKTLRIYNRNNPQDDSAQMRIIRMKLALLGGRHKSNVLMKQNPYRTFEVDDNFKGKFYKVSSDKKSSYDDQSATWLSSNRNFVEYFSVFTPLQDRSAFFNTVSKIPHIWEEIVFRAIPVSLAIISMAFPAVSFLSIPLGIIFFSICQNQFIKAHSISTWIEENNLDWKTSEILFATLFNVFPNKEAKEEFKQYAQQNEVKKQERSRVLPTMLLSGSYLYSLFFAPSIPVVGLATIIGIFVHKYLNLILKNKLNIFDEPNRYAVSPDKDFKIESEHTISLKNSDDIQKLTSVLNGRQITKQEAVTFVDFVLSNEKRYKFFIELLQKIRNRFTGNVELLLETLAERIDITNNNQLNIFNEISKSMNLNWEKVLPVLFKRLDLNNDANVLLIKYFISANQYNSELSSIIIEKADFNNKNHLALLNYLTSVNDDVLIELMNKVDIKNMEHLSLALNSILKARYLLSFNNIFSRIINEIDLSDKQALKRFSEFMMKNSHALDDNNIRKLIQKIDFEVDEQVELLELVLKKSGTNIELIFQLLLNNNINLNDTRYSEIFKTIIDKMLSKYDSYKNAKKYLDTNIFLLPANTIQGKYAFGLLIDILHNKLNSHQNRFLNIVNGRIFVRPNVNGTDPIFENILSFVKDIETRKDLFDSELKMKFDDFMREVMFFKEMEDRTPPKVSVRKRNTPKSADNNVTLEEFCKEKGFSLIKQTPNVFFDSRRYSFTSVLNFISKKLFKFTPTQHNPTYIMTTNTVDTEKLDKVIARFDSYMKLLDENLYILNRLAGVNDFSSQFDDIVNHINLMIDYLEQIHNQGVFVFRRSLKTILSNIKNNKTTIEEQKNLIEDKSSNMLEDIPTINTLVNRIHQQANMSFLMTIMGTMRDYEGAGYNTLISKNDNLISVYNLSSENINPQIESFLSDLAENPDFSTGVKTPIFVKDNILLWVASLGAHSVRILIDFSEETKSVLIDFHEGAIDDGSTIRISMLDSILKNIGFKVEKSTQEFESRQLPVGIVAKLNKDTGLTDSMDFNNLAKQAVILFNNAASLNNLVSGKFQIKHNIDVAKFAIMDIYSTFYALSYIKSNFVRTRINTRRNLNRILKSLELPLIPKKEQGFWTFLKIGRVRVGFIKTYGQNTIDKYVNKPIERAFATGYLKINENGELERNTKYNPIEGMSKKLEEILESEVGQDKETDMLNQGAIISQMPEGIMDYKTVGQIGGYVLKNGYMRLNNGRLDENTKGEFITVTTLTDKNGIIRYTSSEIVGFPKTMNNTSGRISLNSQQLEQILKTEGYDISSTEPLSKLELLNHRSKIQEKIIGGNTPVAYGTIISSPKEHKNIIFARMGKDRRESNLYVDKYASPENVTEAAKYDVSLFAGGSYSSHAGIVLREYGKSAMIVNDSSLSDGVMKIKFYQPKRDIIRGGKIEVQETEEIEIELQPNDIVLIDNQNNKLMLFDSKTFKKGRVGNILFKLQTYIEKQDIEKVKEFINKYKNSEFIDKIIEYIYYQSADNLWLENLLDVEAETYTKQPSIITPRTIVKKVLQITDIVKHTSKNSIYRFGEKESLDAAKVGTKSANQSKLFLTLEQLKKETGIQNVAVPNGFAIGYDILGKLLGEKYLELYEQLETAVEDVFYTDEEKVVNVQDIIAEIRILVETLSEEDIVNYIGTENLGLFKNKLAIVRSSGVGEDSQEYSAAGIAESFGPIEFENISKAIKDTLLSFFSARATDYMSKSSKVIKPAVLIEEWVQSEKAGIMMSEDTNGNRLIQAVNGQCDDVVSGRKTPYTFTIDIKSGTKIDGNYTNIKTLTKEQIEQLRRIMEWLEQAEGVPVDIEFLIKDGIIYIVQVRPVTTLNNQKLAVLPKSLFTSIEDSIPNTYENLKIKQKNKLLKDVEAIKQSFKKYKYDEYEIEDLLRAFVKSEKKLLDADKKNYNIDLTSLIKNKEDLIQITTLVTELLRLKITNLETENNMLGLKIFLNVDFNNIINIDLDGFLNNTTSFVQRYYMALSISRFLSGIIDISKSDYDENQFNEIVRVATKIYISVLDDQQDRVVADRNTKFISLAAVSSYDQSFEDAGLKKLLEVMKIPADSDKVSLINADFVPAIDAKTEFLKQIAALKSEESVFISFDGHGFEDSLEVGFDADISSVEFAKVLIQAYNNGMDLNKITINLSSCFSWYFANKVYDTLNKEFDRLEQNGNAVNRQFPTIWASAGHETVYGYSTYYRENDQLTTMSNEWNGLLSSISESKPGQITIGDLLQAMTVVGYSNPTLFVQSDFIQKTIERGTEQILDIDNQNKTFEQVLTIGERFKQLFKVKKLQNNHINFFELSIFAPLKDKNKLFNVLNKVAPILEEIFFRTLPISLTLLPITSFVAIPLTLIFFAVFQIQFVRAHNITLWIKQNQLDWSTKNILKAVLLNVFPSEIEKQQFDFDQQMSFKEQTKEKILPTIGLSIPYLLSLLFNANIPIVMLVSVIGIIVHKALNSFSKSQKEQVRQSEEFENIYANMAVDKKDDLPLLKEFLADKEFINLRDGQERYSLLEILDNVKLSIDTALELVDKINLNDVNQSSYLLQVFDEQKNTVNENKETIVRALIEKIDVTKKEQLDFINNILLAEKSFVVDWETTSILLKKLDFHNENHIKFLTDFLKAKTYDRSFQNIAFNDAIAEKIDVNDYKQLKLLNLFYDLNDKSLYSLVSNFDFNNKNFVDQFFSYLSRYNLLYKSKTFGFILDKLNLKNPSEFKILSGILEKESYIHPSVTGKIFEFLDFNDRNHLSLIRNIVNKENLELPVIDSFTQYMNMNNSEHKYILQDLCKNIFSKNTRDSHIVLYRKIKEKFDDLNIIDMSDKDKYVFQLLANELILNMQELLTDIQNDNIRAEGDKMIISLIGPQQFEAIIEMINLLTDFESILSKQTIDNFTNLKEQIAYFEKMRAKEVTIEDFAAKYGFAVLQQTPNVYFDSDRYSFTKVLRLFPTKVLKYKIKNLAPTYFVERKELEKEGLKNVLKKFNSYMKLLDENLYVLYRFMNLTAFDTQFDDVVNHINSMINYLAVFNSADAAHFRSVLKDILEEIRNGGTTIAEQKSFSTGRGENIGDITTINRLINSIHQQANMDFVMDIRRNARLSMSKVQNVFVTKGDRAIAAYNLSENEINPNIKRLLFLLAENPDFSTYDNSQIFIKDNIFLWNGLLGDHSARVLIDFSKENENIFIDFTEAEQTPQSRSRIFTLRKILSNFGFYANLYNTRYNLVATISKDSGLTNDTDICESAQRAMVLLSNAASLYRENVPIQVMETASMGIMDLYRKCFFISTDNNIVQTRVNNRKFFNNILTYLQLPTIPQEEPSMASKIKAGFLFKRKVQTFGQNTIDKYVNKPIEQAFATGYLKINGKGELERNLEYNSISVIKESLKNILDTDLGQTQEVDMLNQGALISQIPEREMKFKTIGQIGGYAVKTGYMKLSDGKFGQNLRGEFLAVTTLTDKNGIIRYTTSEIVGFPDTINNKTGRTKLNSQQLKLILEQEGYTINDTEYFTKGEFLTYRNRLKENILKTTMPVAYGTIISSSKESKNVMGVLNAEADNGGVFIDKYASPENITEATQYGISLFTGGSYSSHAGIVLREYGKTAMIVNDSQITDEKMRIKFYQPKGNIDKDGTLESQQMQEAEIELQPNDIVLIDTQNNKMMLFEAKVFKGEKTGNILFELQEYIDSQNVEKIKEFINKYKGSSITDKIIEYIYYQSADNLWLSDILQDYNKQGIRVVPSSDKAKRIINKIQLSFNWFLSHSDTANVYRFGEKESLDAAKVGTKSANQSKLYLSIEQLKKETGIDNVRVPNGFAIDYTILEDLLGQEYKSLHSEFESIIKNKNKNEQDLQRLNEIVSQINNLIKGISNHRIKEYIGKKNLKSLKNKLSIVRSSGVGEDGKSYSAAGIAESYGQVETEKIPQAIKDVLLSFFSERAIDYMINSENIIKPAVLIEEWIDSDKAGIMMSENSEGNGIIQVINGVGEDIVSGRKTPYSFVINIESGEKIDGDYTNEQTLSPDMLSNLIKIMQWLEQVEGVPVDVEFLIKDGIIYIVQVRPITTLDDYTEQAQIINFEEYKYEESEEYTDSKEKPSYDDLNFDVSDEDFLLEDLSSLGTIKTDKSKKSKTAKKIKGEKGKSKNKTKKIKDHTTSVYVSNDDIRQPKGLSVNDAIESSKKLAQSKDPSDSSLKLNTQQIEKVLISLGLSKKEVESIAFSEGLTDYIISLLKSRNSQVTGTTIDSRKNLMDNLREHPILFSLALETFMRVYEKEFGSNATFGDLLSFIEQRYAKRLYEATCTDLRGYFGEFYVANTLIAGIIPDKRAGPIIIRPQLPTDNNIRGFDVYNPVDGVKTQVKTGGSEIVHKHFSKYWFDLSNTEEGTCAIPVITTKNVKENSFRTDDRVQAMDVTTETVTKFAHEFVSALHGIAFKRKNSEIRTLRLTDLIDNFKGFYTENPMTVDELMDLLNKNTSTAKKAKTSTNVIPVNQEIEDTPLRMNVDFILNQDIVLNIDSKQTYVIYIDGDKIFLNEEGKTEISEQGYSLYGIEKVEYDEDGNISYITFKEGVTLSNLTFDGKPKGLEENNVDFSDQEIKQMNFDTETDGVIKIYLDDDVDTICHLIKEAAINKKLIVFHFFRESFKTSDLKPSQLLDIYKKISVLISNRFQMSDIFKNSVDYSQYTDFGLDFFLEEILKNSLLRGSLGRVEDPIAMYVNLDEDKNVEGFSVYNKAKENKKEDLDKKKEALAISAHLMLNGDSKSTEIMTLNPVRDYDFVEEYKIGDDEFRKATVFLRDTVNMDLYHLEQDYKKSRKNVSITDIALQTDGTVNELYKLGFEKYKKEYLEKTGKDENELTSEELSAIDEKAGNYRFTFEGLLKGVKLERYSLFSGKFLSSHTNLSSAITLAVTIIRLLSVGIGVFVTGSAYSIFALSLSSFLANFVIAAPLAIASISVALGVISVIVSSTVMHFLWNFIAVLTNNKDYLLQMENVGTMDIFAKKGSISSFIKFLKKTFIPITIFILPHILKVPLASFSFIPAALSVVAEFVVNSNTGLENILKPINLRKEIKHSEIPSSFVSKAKAQGTDFISAYDFGKIKKKLKRKNFRNNSGIEKYRARTYISPIHRRAYEQRYKYVENSFGFALGLSYTNIFDQVSSKVNLVQAISEMNNIVSWERGYEYFYGPEYPATPPEDYMDKIKEISLEYNKKIFFFLPKNIDSDDFSFKTRKELEYIQQHPEMWKNVVFVFGLYDSFNIKNKQIYDKYFNEDEIFYTMKKLFSNPKKFLDSPIQLMLKIGTSGLIKFFRNLFTLPFSGLLKAIGVLINLEYSKKQTITDNKEAVSRLMEDIKDDNARRVCFVCTANINRSAVSHLLFEDMLLKDGKENIDVVSAGLLPVSQKSKDQDLVLEQDYKKILDDFEVDPDLIDNFRSEEFSQKHIDSDYFIVVSQKHKNLLITAYNIDPAKIILYSDLDSELRGDSLPDPQKFKISKTNMVSLVKNIFNKSLFDFVYNVGKNWFNRFITDRNSNEIIRTVAVSYRHIKASEIEQIEEESMQKKADSSLTGVYIVDDIEQIQDKDNLINTGIKVDGVSIFRIKNGNLLMYGAKGVPRIKIAKALNETEQLKQEIRSLLSIDDEIEIEGIIRRNGDGIGINSGLLEVGEMELFGLNEGQIDDYMLSALEVKNAVGIMYGQKTIINLEKLSGQELLTAIEKGRIRKVISYEQYDQLKLSREQILDLRKKGIEIYIDIEDMRLDNKDYKEKGIAGQVIKEGDKKYIYDYYSGDMIELDVINKEEDLTDLENKMINSEFPIMIDIETLKEHFKGKNSIESIDILGTLLGKIKINMGFGNINKKDIENVGYSISFDKIPDMPLQQIQTLLQTSSKSGIINIIGAENEFGIILNSIKDETVTKKFIEIIKERVFAKAKLKEQGKAFGLKDKKLERLLGKMLMEQMRNDDKETINLMYKPEGEEKEREIRGNEEDIMGKIIEDSERIMSETTPKEIREVAINTIIEIILVYGDDYKKEQISSYRHENITSNYRAMLAAA